MTAILTAPRPRIDAQVYHFAAEPGELRKVSTFGLTDLLHKVEGRVTRIDAAARRNAVLTIGKGVEAVTVVVSGGANDALHRLIEHLWCEEDFLRLTDVTLYITQPEPGMVRLAYSRI